MLLAGAKQQHMGRKKRTCRGAYVTCRDTPTDPALATRAADSTALLTTPSAVPRRSRGQALAVNHLEVLEAKYLLSSTGVK